MVDNANVLPLAVVKVNLSTMLVVTTMRQAAEGGQGPDSVWGGKWLAESISYTERTAQKLKALGGEKGKNTQLIKERDNLKTKAGDLQKS